MMYAIGDEVLWMGVRGKVININPRYEYPVLVEFEKTAITWAFTSDGKQLNWHKEVSLQVVGRKKTYEHGGDYD